MNENDGAASPDQLICTYQDDASEALMGGGDFTPLPYAPLLPLTPIIRHSRAQPLNEASRFFPQVVLGFETEPATRPIHPTSAPPLRLAP